MTSRKAVASINEIGENEQLQVCDAGWNGQVLRSALDQLRAIYTCTVLTKLSPSCHVNSRQYLAPMTVSGGGMIGILSQHTSTMP